jgi:hypothetical protein
MGIGYDQQLFRVGASTTTSDPVQIGLGFRPLARIEPTAISFGLPVNAHGENVSSDDQHANCAIGVWEWRIRARTAVPSCSRELTMIACGPSHIARCRLSVIALAAVAARWVSGRGFFVEWRSNFLFSVLAVTYFPFWL